MAECFSIVCVFCDLVSQSPTGDEPGIFCLPSSPLFLLSMDPSTGCCALKHCGPPVWQRGEQSACEDPDKEGRTDWAMPGGSSPKLTREGEEGKAPSKEPEAFRHTSSV